MGKAHSWVKPLSWEITLPSTFKDDRKELKMQHKLVYIPVILILSICFAFDVRRIGDICYAAKKIQVRACSGEHLRLR